MKDEVKAPFHPSSFILRLTPSLTVGLLLLSSASFEPSFAEFDCFGACLVVLLDAVDGSRLGRVRAGRGLLLRADEAEADVGERLFVGRRLDAVDVELEELREVEARDARREALELVHGVAASLQVVTVVRAL